MATASSSQGIILALHHHDDIVKTVQLSSELGIQLGLVPGQ